MTLFRRILVPRDFSPPSEAALRIGLDLASASGAVLHVVHVEVLDEDPFGRPEHAAGPGVRLRERLKEVVDRDRGAGPPYDPASVRMEHAVVRGVAAPTAILDYAAAHGIDLIVMGRHGRRGLQRAVLGSVAEAVTREASCPVATVPAGPPPSDGPPRVLAATDFSPQSEGAAAFAARLAALLDGDVDLVHVARAAGPSAHLDGEAAARARLGALADSILTGLDDPPAVRPSVTVGRAGDQIAERARETSVAFVVVGMHDRSGLARLLGSVADQVLREAPCPVVVCHSAGERRSGSL